MSSASSATKGGLEAFWRRLLHEGSVDNLVDWNARRRLGSNTKNKLLVVIGIYIIWYTGNALLHSFFRIEQGTIRIKILKAVLRNKLKSLILIPGLSVLLLWLNQRWLFSLGILPKRWLQKLLLMDSKVDNAIETFVKQMHEYGQDFSAFQTYSEGEKPDEGIGWLCAKASATMRAETTNVTPEVMRLLRRLDRSKFNGGSVSDSILKMLMRVSALPKFMHPHITRRNVVDILGVPPQHLFPHGWDSITVFLVPGLLCDFYPLYFTPLEEELQALGIDVVISKIDTGLGIMANAATLKKEIEEMYNEGEGHRKIIVYGHSKGAVDTLTALSVYPSLRKLVYGFVSAQAPMGGSWLANDINNTTFQKKAILTFVEKILVKKGDAVFDMSYHSRMKHWDEGKIDPDVWRVVPTICLATSTCQQPGAFLSPVAEYARYRYGDERGMSDGLVMTRDAVIPGTQVCMLPDMDHCGPGWVGFPAMDKYNTTHLALALIAMVIKCRRFKKSVSEKQLTSTLK